MYSSSGSKLGRGTASVSGWWGTGGGVVVVAVGSVSRRWLKDCSPLKWSAVGERRGGHNEEEGLTCGLESQESCVL